MGRTDRQTSNLDGVRPWPTFLLAALLASACTAPEPARTPAPEPEPQAAAPEPAPLPLAQGLPGRTPVLTYHDVIARRDANAVWFDATQDEFRDQIDWLLEQGAEFISLDQLRQGLVGQIELPDRAVALTFADNYAGFYERAWPLLRERGIPVAMFVHTSMVGSRQGRPKMTWEQLRELADTGLVTVGSQTVSHPKDLAQLTDEQVAREMVESKLALERELGRPCLYVAYPNGKFDQRSVEAARSAGYLMAFTEEQTPAELSPSLFEVARYVHTKYRQAWKEGAP